MCVEPN